jgi:uncharacterized membrane protein
MNSVFAPKFPSSKLTEAPSTTRMEAFSDAIFAIIMTLLVLELRIPEFHNPASNAEIIHALLKIVPNFISFGVTFLILAVFWVNHHQFFHFIKRSDRALLWLNNFLLFWLCFLPFPTAILGQHPTSTAAVMLFGAALFLAATSFTVMSHYVYFKSHLFSDSIMLADRKAQFRRSLVGTVLYGASVVLAPVSIYISIAIFVILPLYYFVPSLSTMVRQEA